MKTYGIIGWPLGHSFSRGYFEAKFAALGLADHRYLEFPIENISGLRGVLEAYPDLCGFNVTLPYKKEVMAWLDSVSDGARAIGAVNCVKITDGRLEGYNTDAHGFLTGLEELIGSRKPSALVLGTGGAANAVRYALGQSGIEFLTVSRTAASADTRTASARTITYGELTPEIMADCKLIVNATPLGTWPDVDGKPDIPYECVGAGHFLYDLVYNPSLTAFLAEGACRGASIINGEKMLYSQAEKNWKIWNGRNGDNGRNADVG